MFKNVDFRSKVSAADNALTVEAMNEDGEMMHSFSLDEGNKLVTQSQKLDSLPADLDLRVSGTGCYMVQTVLR